MILEDFIENKSKTAYQIFDMVINNIGHTLPVKQYKWISVDEVKAFFANPKIRVCPLKHDCLDCGENIWCYSDEQLEQMEADGKEEDK